MNFYQKTFIAACLLCCISCNNNKASSNNEALSAPKEEAAPTSSTPAPGSGEGIVGRWQMNQEAFDNNENKVLDDEERKAATRNSYRLKLNADGSCRIQDFYNGTYKVKEEGGNKILEVQRKKIEGEEKEDPIPDIYYIKSMTKDEMVLLTTEAGFTVSFWIFKRL